MNSNAAQADVAKNIMNAFTVVRNTYKNLHRFLSELDTVADEEGFFPITDKFLRWKSDQDWRAWLITSFMKLFQNKNDQPHPAMENLRSGPVYFYCVILP